MVFIVDKNEGWDDFYRFNTYIPWPISVLGVAIVAVLITTALRLAHNAIYKMKQRLLKKEFEKLFEIYDKSINNSF